MTAAPMTFADALARLDSAAGPDELFGADAPVRQYRRLARLLHPDAAPAGQSATATAAFARLATLWAQRSGPATVLAGRRHRYHLGDRIAGDVADLYPADSDGRAVLVKIPRSPGDSDLLAREATALATLARDGDPEYRAYAPALVESFRHEDPATGARRTVNVLDRCHGFVSLAEVAGAFDGGLDPRDVAWMWRRLLVAIGWAHRAGVVHGAIIDDHVLIHPGEHGLVLVDWCYSVLPGGTVPALVTRYRDRYPPEVAARRPATAATDIHLATGCMQRLMGDRAHPALLRFARGCTLPAPRMRPQDAWQLLAELDELLAELYGPRTFRPFALPR